MKRDDKFIQDGILARFAELCCYPHPSGGEGPLVDYVEKLLRSWGLAPARDQWNNLMADVPASPGREDAPLTILQGHLDMVCAVKPGSGYDPCISPIVCKVEDGLLCSDGNSSLGADNNLGNAVVLWLMEQQIPHGPVRLLFTVEEEVGLVGAKNVDPTWLAGADYLINTDGFALGKAVVSSAGGLRETFSKAIKTVVRRKNKGVALSMIGFPGGHSGYDIHRGRTNPVARMGAFLRDLNVGYELICLSGGHAHNAIPTECIALIAIDEDDLFALSQEVKSVSREIQDGQIKMEECAALPESAWETSFRDSVLDAVENLRIGVYAWRDREREQVSASANLGQITQMNDVLSVAAFIRAAGREERDALAAQHRAVMEGFALAFDEYPGWPEQERNPLTDAMATVWNRLTGQEMEINSVHVGLEPSVLGAKNPEMVMVNTGPEIWDPHSLSERAPIEGLPDYARLLAGTLEALSRK